MSASSLVEFQTRLNSDEALTVLLKEIAFVEEELKCQIRSSVALVEAVGKQTLVAGGKRLRPALVTLCAQVCGQPFDIGRSRRLSAAMELIHMASLVHDDVVDNAAMRRGISTAGSSLGNTAAILSGDVLLARSMSILAEDGDLTIMRRAAKAVENMAEGQVRELEVRGNFDLAECAHVSVLNQKTALFIQVCCEIGGTIGNGSNEDLDCLGRYGHEIGMAFQIADDLLDYRGDKSKTGKAQATDFREGLATLPLIGLREKLSQAESEMARSRFGGEVSDDEVRMIVDWMDTRGAFEAAELRARSHVEAAVEALRAFPESNTRQLLESVAEFSLSRKS